MEPVRDYELSAFFSYVVEVLESLDIPYMVVGGFAAIFYGEPRLTIDVDIVVDMRPSLVRSFVACFPIADYYVSESAIYDALDRQYPFNVIQPTTGAKVDLVPLSHDTFTRAAFERRQRIQYDATGRSASFIGPEDIVIAKLIAFRETGSDKHLRDVCGVLTTQRGRLDEVALERRARVVRVSEQLDYARKLVQQEDDDF